MNISSLIKNTINIEGWDVLLKGSVVTSSFVFLNTLFSFVCNQYILDIFKDDLKRKNMFLPDYKINIKNLVYSHSNKPKFICDKSNDSKVNCSSCKKYRNSEEFKQQFKYWNQKLTLISAKAGFFSGILSAFIFSPFDNVRIRIFSYQNVIDSKNKKYKNNTIYDTVYKVIKKEGLIGLYTGLSLSLLRESFASTIYFSFFEYNMNKIRIEEFSYSNYLWKFYFGALSGGIVWTTTLPLDVIKTRYISDRILAHCKFCYKGIFDCSLITYNKEGFKGFYTGYKLMIIRSFIVNGFVLTAYDVFRDHFNLND